MLQRTQPSRCGCKRTRLRRAEHEKQDGDSCGNGKQAANATRNSVPLCTHGNLVSSAATLSFAGPLDVAAVEREGLQEVRSCHHCPQLSCGYMNRYWTQFKREIRPGDALIFFHSERKREFGLFEGYAIVRNGRIVKSTVGKIG